MLNYLGYCWLGTGGLGGRWFHIFWFLFQGVNWFLFQFLCQGFGGGLGGFSGGGFLGFGFVAGPVPAALLKDGSLGHMYSVHTVCARIFAFSKLTGPLLLAAL